LCPLLLLGGCVLSIICYSYGTDNYIRWQGSVIGTNGVIQLGNSLNDTVNHLNKVTVSDIYTAS